MAIRKRKWTTRTGEVRENWIFDYRDQHGDRHIRTFARRKDAEDYQATVKVDIQRGVHTAPSKSVTVAEAADDWLKFSKGEGLERATLAVYRTHVAHIVARIGNQKLTSLTKPSVNKFRDELVADLSRSLASKVMTSFKAIIKDAERRGNVAQNVATGVTVKRSKRDKRKLVVGVDIPTVEEIQKIIAAARGRYRPLLLTAIFTGLRSSELRGLRWEDIDLKRNSGFLLHVRQRADRYGKIGVPKSAGSRRTVPIMPMLANVLREWKLKCEPSKHGLAFPTSSGRVARHGDLVRKVFIPTVKRAGLLDTEGKAKYTGLHTLRHFYASRLINARADGGLELPAKVVQERLGHSSIVMTMDVYGHLFPRGDDDGAEAKAEAALFETRTHSASR
jgi:integrase